MEEDRGDEEAFEGGDRVEEEERREDPDEAGGDADEPDVHGGEPV